MNDDDDQPLQPQNPITYHKKITKSDINFDLSRQNPHLTQMKNPVFCFHCIKVCVVSNLSMVCRVMVSGADDSGVSNTMLCNGLQSNALFREAPRGEKI